MILLGGFKARPGLRILNKTSKREKGGKAPEGKGGTK